MDFVVAIANQLLEILLASSPYILLGFLIAGISHVFLPTSLFGRIFGSAGLMPLLRAIGIGSLIPVCSCGVVPIGLGAHRSGSGTGTVLAFMTAAPTLSPAAVILSANLLGWEMTLWQIVAVLVGSLLIGLIGNRWFTVRQSATVATVSAPPAGELVSLSMAPDDAAVDDALPACCQTSAGPARSTSAAMPSCCGETADETTPSLLRRSTAALHWTFWEFGPSVSLDLLFGLLFAAAVLVFVPTPSIAAVTGSGTLWSLLLVILIALPVYTCSMAAIPVVFTFLVAGMSPGAAVAFIIAGPATNFGEMNAIRTHMGWRVAVFYFLSMLLVAVLSGLCVDHAIQLELTADILDQQLHQHLHGASVWAYLATGITGLMMLVELVRRIGSQITRLQWRPREQAWETATSTDS